MKDSSPPAFPDAFHGMSGQALPPAPAPAARAFELADAMIAHAEGTPT